VKERRNDILVIAVAIVIILVSGRHWRGRIQKCQDEQFKFNLAILPR